MKPIVLSELGIFMMVFPKVVTEPDLISGFQAAFVDERNITKFNGVFDLRLVEHFDLTQSTLGTLAYLIGANRTPHYRSAHVVKTQLQIGTSNMCMSFADMQIVEEARQFRGMREAFEWLCGIESVQAFYENRHFQDFEEVIKLSE